MAEAEKKEIITLGKCPMCDGEIVEKAKSFACTKSSWKNEGSDDEPNWKNDGCNYSIFKGSLNKLGGTDITSDEVKTLLKDGSFQKELNIIVDEKYGLKINFSAN